MEGVAVNSNDRQEFEKWMTEYKKHYDSDDEKEKRFKAFQRNLRLIEADKAINANSTDGLNVFSDLTPEEFYEQYIKPPVYPPMYDPTPEEYKKQDAWRFRHIDCNIRPPIYHPIYIPDVTHKKQYGWRDNKDCTIPGDSWEFKGYKEISGDDVLPEAKKRCCDCVLPEAKKRCRDEKHTKEPEEEPESSKTSSYGYGRQYLEIQRLNKTIEELVKEKESETAKKEKENAEKEAILERLTNIESLLRVVTKNLPLSS